MESGNLWTDSKVNPLSVLFQTTIVCYFSEKKNAVALRIFFFPAVLIVRLCSSWYSCTTKNSANKSLSWYIVLCSRCGNCFLQWFSHVPDITFWVTRRGSISISPWHFSPFKLFQAFSFFWPQKHLERGAYNHGLHFPLIHSLPNFTLACVPSLLGPHC